MSGSAQQQGDEGRLQFGGREIAYIVERTSRRKSIAVSVDLTGVRVLAPADANAEEVEATLRRKAPWVIAKLALVAEMGQSSAAREFVSGETFHYLGRGYRLRVLPDPSAVATRIRLSGRHMLAPVAEGLDERLARIAVRRGLIVWYEGRARDRLPKRIAAFAERVGIRPPHLLVRDQEKRWGSCDAQGRIRANWRLMTLPLPLIDYVLAHEVCHVREPNHRAAVLEAAGGGHAGLGDASRRAPQRRAALRVVKEIASIARAFESSTGASWAGGNEDTPCDGGRNGKL